VLRQLIVSCFDRRLREELAQHGKLVLPNKQEVPLAEVSFAFTDKLMEDLKGKSVLFETIPYEYASCFNLHS
jgi:hypothetical protein